MTTGPGISEQLAAARGYTAAGLSVIPIRADGSKAPAVIGWRQFAERVPTPAEMGGWWGPDATAIYGVGIPGGPAGGNLAVLDFETAAAWEAWRARVASDTIDWLDDCPRCRPPGGGVHLYVRLPEPVPGIKLARDRAGKTLIETRGDNHQVVAPGSPAACHPTGRPYRWESRGWLDGGFRGPVGWSVWFDWIDLAAAQNEYVTPAAELAPPAKPRGRDAAHTDPGTDFNHRGAWEESGLFDAGWVWARQIEYQRGFVRRPGKAAGTSGTVGLVHSKANRWPLFWCFTSNGLPFSADTAYDRFGVYARLRHRGDMTSAARTLATLGYGTPRPQKSTQPAPAARTPAATGEPVPAGGPPDPEPEPEDGTGQVTPAPADAGGKKPTSRFTFIPVAEFLSGDYRPRWIVPRILVKGQPGVIAAPSKGMKTSVLLDLAVSVATASPFLGTFPVRERHRVAVCSGESGEHTIKETLLRILAAKGLAPAAAAGWLTLEFNLPVFTDLVSMSDFRGHVERVQADLLVIDPTYLCMGDVDARNLFEMGRALRGIADHLKSARPDLTVILVHHANRMLPVGEPMELQHLAYSGLEQYARQFFLMNRREPYRNDGRHSIWFRVGGSAGHGGLWDLHIDEGLVSEDFSGRRWDVSVFTPDQAGKAADAAKEREDRERQREDRERQRERDRQDEAAVLLVIDAEAARALPGASVSWIEDHVEFGGERVKRAVDRLVDGGAIMKVQSFEKPAGNGAKRTVKNGFGRTPDDG